MIFVIGSGPAGVATASALLARGVRVTMIDVGEELELKKKQLLAEDQVNAMRWRHTLDSKNPLKLSYGSAFPYAKPDPYFKLRFDDGIACFLSFARGGLSNVWGAFVDRYNDVALATWPITGAQLAPYYPIVERLLQATPANVVQASGYRLSKQAQSLFQDFTTYDRALNQAGFTFSPALLAVRFNDATHPCHYCASCQHGCPSQLIYNAAHTLQTLMANPAFTYINHTVVQSLEESEAQVKISGVDFKTQAPISLVGDRVFVACGPIISTVLLLKMLGKQRATFLDSSHFILPCFMRRRIKSVTQEKLHTLCQLFLKLEMPEMAQGAINLQIYTYMDHYADKLQALFKGFYPIIRPLLQPLLDRLIVIQGHLDSTDSHGFSMAYDSSDSTVKLTSILNASTTTVLNCLVKHLKKNSKALGFFPIARMLQISKITKSFHYGASMPMTAQPKNLETDVWGRPVGVLRVSVVDATIFPSIPGGSITPTIMANAYRIATECPL